jgi:hypothetical protein
MRVLAVSFFCVVAGASFPAAAQNAAPPPKSPYVSVIGTVEKADSAGKVITVKPDKSDTTTVKYDDRTSFLQIPAGETDQKKATPATASDVAVGDRVVARVLSADPTGKPARSFYITKQADLAQLREKTQEDWKTATHGVVASIDPAAKQIRINLKAAGSPALKEVVIDVGGRVNYQHYSPDSGKYETASLDALKTGDQLRVLGQKNTDGSEIKAEDVGFGSFKTIGVQVKSIDAAAKQIQGVETGSKKPVVIALRDDTSLKKFNEMAASMVARQLNPTYQQPGGRSGRGSFPGNGSAAGVAAAGTPGGTPGAPAGAAGGAPGAAGASGSPGGRGGFPGGRGMRAMDVGHIIEQQPSIQLSDLKAGDAVIVTGAYGNDPSRITAIALVAGVEPILRAAPSSGADPLAGSWNMGAAGGDTGGAQ